VNRAHATPRAHFTKAPVTMARDPTLSLKAKGLGCLLRSFPGDWTIHRSYVERFTSDGRDAVRGAFRELTAAGHLVERRPRHPKRSDLPHQGRELRADRREAPSADERFVMIRNAALRDPTLSLKAKGLLVVLLSFPPRSPMSIQALTAHAADGKASIATAMRELERAGYVHRRPQARKADGTYANTTRLATDRPTNTSEGSRGAAREQRAHDAARAATGEPRRGENVVQDARRTACRLSTKKGFWQLGGQIGSRRTTRPRHVAWHAAASHREGQRTNPAETPLARRASTHRCATTVVCRVGLE
jgi:hypothetical protein